MGAAESAVFGKSESMICQMHVRVCQLIHVSYVYPWWFDLRNLKESHRLVEILFGSLTTQGCDPTQSSHYEVDVE